MGAEEFTQESVDHIQEDDRFKKPNLFNYATSELSQDAFICWLLKWADPKYKKEDEQLHLCGVNLIHALYKDSGMIAPKTIDKVEIAKQLEKIDVFCEINDRHAIIIEDKTNTQNHSNQLQRYYEATKRKYKDENILKIYYKTGDQCNYKDIEDKGYKLFLRKDILEILNDYAGEHPILLDYRKYIQDIEDRTSSYQTLPLDKWTEEWLPWIGFFKEIQSSLQVKGSKFGWGYVPNPTGGFLGLWWHFRKVQNCSLYLLLEGEKLCFKIDVKDKGLRGQLRNKWNGIVEPLGTSYKLKLHKPKRFGSGQNMTLCKMDEYRVTGDDGHIDINKTVDVLRKAEQLLDEAVMENKLHQ